MNTLPAPGAGLLMSTPESTAPAAFDRAIIGSFTVRFSVLRVVVVPLTVRLPDIVTFDGKTGSVRFAFKSKLLHTNSFEVSRLDMSPLISVMLDHTRPFEVSRLDMSPWISVMLDHTRPLEVSRLDMSAWISVMLDHTRPFEVSRFEMSPWISVMLDHTRPLDVSRLDMSP